MDLKAKLSAPFPARDIEWRVGRDGKKGNGEVWSRVLAYVDARAVMDRLDDAVGPENWKDRYWRENGGTMCALAIKVGEEWIEKVDGSEDTDIEPFKGGISKALVRTAVKWGIGRYLYGLGEEFAQIVERGTKGARYQRSKEAGEYYWLEPSLPDWALPPKTPITASNDKDTLDSLAAWKIPVGKKYKGLALGEIELNDLRDFAAWMNEKQDIRGELLETRDRINTYLCLLG